MGRRPGRLGLGVATLWLSVIVLLPLAAVVAKATEVNIWEAATRPAALDALKLTLGTSFIVAAINAVFGTLTAWVLVRDEFRGKAVIDTLIDLPFALPTIVAGLTLLALYGNNSPVGIDIARTHAAIVLALLFITLPFVVRAVQPVLMELDTEMEEASASLGASGFTTFRRIILPNLMPAILSGTALSFARAVGEFGSIVIVAGANRDNQVASTYIFSLIETDNTASAAAVSVVLLVIALAVLFAIRLIEQRGTRHRAH